MGLGGCQNKQNMAWWFFQGFKQGIKSTGGHHVHFINDINFIFSFDRRVLDLVNQFTNFIDSVVARRINFDDVGMAVILKG